MENRVIRYGLRGLTIEEMATEVKQAYIEYMKDRIKREPSEVQIEGFMTNWSNWCIGYMKNGLTGLQAIKKWQSDLSC